MFVDVRQGFNEVAEPEHVIGPDRYPQGSSSLLLLTTFSHGSVFEYIVFDRGPYGMIS